VTKDLAVRTKTLTNAPVERQENRDEFDHSTLNFYWNFLRNPLEGSWSLTDKPGTLVLQGNKNSLNDIASPAWVGRRQEHFNCTIETKLSFEASSDNEEAGLTIYQNFQHHYDFALTHRKDIQALIIRKTIGDIVSESVTIPMVGEQVFLKIQGNKDLYIFSYSLDGQKFQEAGTAIPQYLGTELASSFTGVYFAMYATGIGYMCQHKAIFDYFEYQNTATKK